MRPLKSTPTITYKIFFNLKQGTLKKQKAQKISTYINCGHSDMTSSDMMTRIYDTFSKSDIMSRNDLTVTYTHIHTVATAVVVFLSEPS